VSVRAIASRWRESLFDDDWEEDQAEGLAGAHTFRGDALAVGVIASAPWLLLYEWALANPAWGTTERRNVAEILLGAGLGPLGEHAATARVLLILAAVGIAAWHCVRAEVVLLPRLLRTGVEGGVAALAMGPMLVALGRLFGDAAPRLPLAEWYPSQSPSLSYVSFVAGGAAYEEVCFRLLLFCALFVLSRHLLSFFGTALPIARFVAEVLAMLGSALAFSASHLERFTSLVGWRGEPFDGPLFFWRMLAGILLFAVMRWRGLGVAVWAHALFNLGLVLGVGPAVLQSP
jgi:hypothetical protein